LIFIAIKIPQIMEMPWIHRTDALTLCIILFIAMLIMFPLGRMAGRARKQADDESKGIGALQSALFGLSAFILAFTFGMSASRYSNVREIITDEANDIGTALLRSDLYPDSVRDEFRNDFKNYIDARVSFYTNATDTVLFNQAKTDAATAATALWSRAMQQSKLPGMLIPSNNMIPALNSMFDIATTIEMTLYARVPDVIVYMLFILAIATSFIGGFTNPGIRRKEWIVVIVFSLFSSMVTYITLDLGRPMRGIIKADIGIHAITSLKKGLP
jgi:hypothetical protein